MIFFLTSDIRGPSIDCLFLLPPVLWGNYTFETVMSQRALSDVSSPQMPVTQSGCFDSVCFHPSSTDAPSVSGERAWHVCVYLEFTGTNKFRYFAKGSYFLKIGLLFPSVCEVTIIRTGWMGRVLTTWRVHAMAAGNIDVGFDRKRRIVKFSVDVNTVELGLLGSIR